MSLPRIGWITILILGVMIVISIIIILSAIYRLLLKKDFKTNFFSVQTVTQQQKELYIAEGKDQLDNQCQVAKQHLRELRLRIYTGGLLTFDMKDQKDQDILELISYYIIDRVNYEVKNDLTRNNITHKSDIDLKEYSDAKAKGYYLYIKDCLYRFNSKLPEFNLPEIMHKIPESDICILFHNIYSAAKAIAGNQIKDEIK